MHVLAWHSCNNTVFMEKKMTKTRLIPLCLMLMLSASIQARPMADIQSSGTLKVGVPGDYAPLAWHGSDGKLKGYDIDMASALGQSLGLKVEFVTTSWPDLSSDLAADKFDVAMGGVTATPQRAAQFGLTAPIVPNGKIAIANCRVSDTLNGLAQIDRPEVKLVVNPGGTNQSFVDSTIKQAQIIRVKNNVDNLQALRESTADVMITDLIEGDYYHNQEPGVLCMATQTPFTGTASSKVYMVQKSNEALLKAINAWLAGETKNQLAVKWKIRLPE